MVTQPDDALTAAQEEEAGAQVAHAEKPSEGAAEAPVEQPQAATEGAAEAPVEQPQATTEVETEAQIETAPEAEAPVEQPQAATEGAAEAPVEQPQAATEVEAEAPVKQPRATKKKVKAEAPVKQPRATKKKVEAEEDVAHPEIPSEEEAFQEGRVWYVIHTYSGHENKVKTNLEHRTVSMDAQDLIFRVVVPTEDEIEIREGARRTVARKIFPGYILVQMVKLQEENMDSTQAWFIVRNTPGVTGFVGSGTRPVPLEEDEVRRILSQMRVEQPRVKVGFELGESVRIVDGPFLDFVGQVDEINVDRGKVKVLVSFFGRETPVELDFLQVERL